MKKKLVSALSLALLGCFGLPAWSQSFLPPPEGAGVWQTSAETTPSAPQGAAAVWQVSAETAPPPQAAAPVTVEAAAGNCGASCGATSDEAPLGSFIAGGGLYFMTPYFQSNAAFIQRRTDKTGNDVFLHETDFSQNMEVAPLVWVGYVFDNGWGVRARWFDFNSNANESSISPGPTGGNSTIYYVPGGDGFPVAKGDVVAASEHLGVDVFDIEATNNFQCGCWAMLASAGIRYAHVSQSYDINEFGPGVGVLAPPTKVLGTVTSSNDFNGAGPTMGLEVHRAIGDTDFGFYSSARGSILFGSSHQVGQGQLNVDPVFLSGSEATLVSIGELEIGGEWSTAVGRAHLVAQVGLVGQVWWGAGNSTDVQSLFNVNNNDSIHSAIPAGGNFGFIGGVARFGVSF